MKVLNLAFLFLVLVMTLAISAQDDGSIHFGIGYPSSNGEPQKEVKTEKKPVVTEKEVTKEEVSKKENSEIKEASKGALRAELKSFLEQVNKKESFSQIIQTAHDKGYCKRSLARALSVLPEIAKLQERALLERLTATRDWNDSKAWVEYNGFISLKTHLELVEGLNTEALNILKVSDGWPSESNNFYVFGKQVLASFEFELISQIAELDLAILAEKLEGGNPLAKDLLSYCKDAQFLVNRAQYLETLEKWSWFFSVVEKEDPSNLKKYVDWMVKDLQKIVK